MLPKYFVVTPVRILDYLIDEIRNDSASPVYEPSPPPDPWWMIQSITAGFGSYSFLNGNVAVMSVPSSIIPQERNYVLNPAHTKFNEIEFLAPEPFHFDSRLKQSA